MFRRHGTFAAAVVEQREHTGNRLCALVIVPAGTAGAGGSTRTHVLSLNPRMMYVYALHPPPAVRTQSPAMSPGARRANREGGRATAKSNGVYAFLFVLIAGVS